MSFADQEFEHALLASARADEPPADTRAAMTDQAWARFSARAAAVGDALRGQAPQGETARDAGPAPAAKRRVTGGVHWRWLLAGVLGGSAVTAGLFARRSPVQVAALTVGADEPSPPSTTAAPASAVPVASPARIEQRPASRREKKRRNPQTDRASVEATVLAAPPSNLAAEVAALDAARAAAASREFDQALALISRYHYDFPAGELAADAEVIAIEALDAKNDRAAMARRASRFVEQYPDDPHAARIKRLLVPRPSR